MDRVLGGEICVVGDQTSVVLGAMAGYITVFSRWTSAGVKTGITLRGNVPLPDPV